MPKKVFVSGCFDMLHSGHVAFFQEAAQYGDLYVAIGSDRNVFALKNRPTINTQDERLYMIQSLACVKQVFVARGSGILDFVEELKEIKPDIFVVNEDGSTPEKQKLCAELGIKYRVLKRQPHSGLTVRSTTALRSSSLIPDGIKLAGGQLDQPSASQIVPGPVLSISIHPTLEWTTPTRAAAVELWGARLPADRPEKLAKILFGYSNLPGTREICGAQAALGITFSGLTRADYAGEYWPEHITNIRDERVLKFIEDTLYLLPLPPAGPPQPENSQIYADSLGLLATASEACWQALLNTNLNAFGQGLRQSFEAQLAISPRLLTRERLRIVEAFREQALGWQVSGGHLLLVSAQPVKNALRLSIRRESD